MAHPTHGQVQLTPAPELPMSRRYDQAAVRAFRHRLSSPDARSFGITPAASSGRRRAGTSAWLWRDAVPVTSFDDPGQADMRPALVTLVPHPDDVGGAHGVVQIRLSDEPGRATRFSGRLRLARAPYPQLTEGGPLLPIQLRPSVELSPEMVVLSDSSLGAAAAIRGLDLAGADARVGLDRGWLVLDVPVRRTWTSIAVGMGRHPDDARAACAALASVGPDALLAASGRRWAERWRGWPSRPSPFEAIARRSLAYAIGCCVVPLEVGTCLITDHRLLPLAWMRDGYFVARAFLDWAAATGATEPVDIVRGHLRWLFEAADRPDGWWARSHLIGGQRKDAAFQADQQLYPLLELADHTIATRDRAPLRAYAAQIPDVLAALDARADPRTGLLGTEESAADDPAAAPYQTATQILAWRTFMRLSEIGVRESAFADRADQIRRAVYRHLVASVAGRRVFAHAIDARGHAILYHDANDLPLALGPDWGFCRADDPVWAATVAAVLGPTHEGFAAGPFGGLGSVHTPGPWPLGQLQSLIVGRARGDTAQVAVAEAAILAEAQWDDLLPEASDPATAAPISRPWFAWPNAVAASAYLDSLPPDVPRAS
jgi:hypothetical protein